MLRLPSGGGAGVASIGRMDFLLIFRLIGRASGMLRLITGGVRGRNCPAEPDPGPKPAVDPDAAGGGGGLLAAGLRAGSRLA